MQKSTTIYSICKDYLTIDDEGILDFKSTLKEEIKNNKISKFDAIYIVLDLLYSVKINLGYKDISKKLFELLSDVKILDNNTKHKKLFFKSYLTEIHIIIDYITLLAEERNIKNNIHNSRNNIYDKNKIKSIKKYLNRFSREELFVILDLNSDVNFEKDKILKNRIANELSKIPFDETILKNSSPRDIKKLLKSNYISNSEIIRLQNKDLFSLIEEFEKRLKERSKEDYFKYFNQKPNIDIKELVKKDQLRKIEEKNSKLDSNEKLEEINDKKSKHKNLKENLKEKQFKRIQKFKKEKKIGIYNKTNKNNITKNEELKKELKNLDNLEPKKDLDLNKKQKNVLSENSKYEEKSLNNKRNVKNVNNISKIKKSNVKISNKETKQIKSKIDKELNEKLNLLNVFKSEINNDGFLSSKKREKLIKKYHNLYIYFSNNKNLLKLRNMDFLHSYDDLKEYTNLSDTPKDNEIRKINEKYLDEKINKNKYFFKDITDIFKKRAIVIDEENVKVIAGAGTGKTFTIQNKVRYLIEHEGISPEKILCLCYTGKGAEDLKKKVNEFSNGDYKITACTFHGFCRDIIKNYFKIEISTKKDLLDEIVLNYMMDIVTDDKKLEKLVNYFSYYNIPPADENEFTTYDELLAYETGRELKQLKEKYYGAGSSIQTLDGQIVKSIGELMIANYLFMHDIEYKYELEYQHNFSKMIKYRFLDSGHYSSMRNISQSKKQIVNEYIKLGKGWENYRPDFYFPEKQIYLEHFGISGKNDEKWLGKEYLKQMDEKREFHKKNGSKLIETYYSYLVDENLLEKLEKLLKDNDIKIGQKDKKFVLDILKTIKKVDDFKIFKELVLSFINIFEANNLHKNEFDRFKKDNQSVKDNYKKNRQELFLDIVSDIYDKYFDENEPKYIDYNRQVSLALELIQSKKFNKSYEYILIDEYQDINPIRCQFLQELQKNTGAKMFVVGDDWQSIYGFNGSDLKLFIDFDNYFPNSELIKIRENRRNCNNLNNIACKFIQKNKIQEKKNLKSIDSIKNLKHPIKIIRYDNEDFNNDNVLKLYLIIRSIINHNPKKENAKILVLGRGNKDINEYIDNILFEIDRYDSSKIICNEKPNVNIQFMTIHKSKGLEFDEVVILNLEDKINGFPNKIEDDPLLRFVKNNKECSFAEERRLLYVALTRTKNNVYLLAPKKEASDFIRELIKLNAKNYPNIPNDKRILRNYYFPKRKVIGDFELRESNIKCPNCDDGKITIVHDKFHNKKYVRCSTDPTPDSNHYNGGPFWGKLRDVRYIEKCPSCNGILIKGYFNDKLVCTNNRKGCNEEKKLF